jgi:hypothetical protein
MKIPAFIKHLVKVCDTKTSRYALGGIKCQSDGTTAQLTATDGRILANVYFADDDATPYEVIVEGKQLASVPAAAFKDKRGVTFDGQTIRHGGTRADLAPIEGRFPRFEDVFTIHDEPDGYVAVKLDPAYLKTLCELAHGVGGEACKGVVLWVKDAQSCVFGDARSSEGHVARLAIMPLAADTPNGPLAFPARPGEHHVGQQGEGQDGAPQPVPPPDVGHSDASVATSQQETSNAAGMAFAVPEIA